jgi:ABC-2 family transporter protein
VKFSIPLNPVLARELRARGRRKSVPFLVAIFLAIITGIAWNIWRTDTRNIGDPAFGTFAYSSLTSIGRNIFEWTSTTLFALVAFLVPGFTAGAITGERDRQTLVPMQVTLLRPRQIILGKMLSSSSYTVFLLVVSIPVLAVGYTIGGVSLGEVLRSIGGLFVVASFWASLAIFASSIVKRTAPAIVLAYALMLVFLVVTLIIAGISTSIGVLATNPFVVFSDFVFHANSSVLVDFSNGGPMSGSALTLAGKSPPYWVRGGVMMVLVTLVCVWIAVRRVTTPRSSER